MDGHSHTSFTALVIIATAAFVTPIVVSKIRWVKIPVVVGELIVGIIIGRSGFDIVQSEEWLTFLSTLGITYLMFLSGVEIDFRVLRRMSATTSGRQVFSLTTLYFVGVLVAAGVAGITFTRMGFVHNPWLVAIILTTVSVGVVLPTLKERGMGPTELGQTILVTAVLMDFATMLLLTVLVTLISGEDPAKLALIILLFGGGFITYLVGTHLRERAFIRELAHATSQIGVRGAFMLIFIFAFLSQRLGIEFILGAFLAGAIVSLISETDETSLHLKLDAIGFGFLVPIFFIMVGAEFDLAALMASPQSLLLALSIVVVAYVVKGIPAAFFARRYTVREAFGIGILVTPGLSLTVAAAEIGFRLELLSSATHSAMILLAIVTAAISPILFEKLVPRSEDEGERERLVIVGANERGVLLATRLADLGERLVLVDKDGDHIESVRTRGFEAVRADATSADEWRRIDLVDEDSTVVVATQSDEVNLSVVKALTDVGGVKNLVAHAVDPGASEAMNRLGARTVSPSFATILVMENIARHPDLFALLNHEDDAIGLERFVVENEALTRVPVREIHLPKGALILSVHRGREHIIPRGDTLLRLGDVLTIAGETDEVKTAIRALSVFAGKGGADV